MPKITEMFVFAMDQADGGEGIPAFSRPDGLMIPLVGADLARVTSLRTVAQEFATMAKSRVRLLKFTVREELEVFEP